MEYIFTFLEGIASFISPCLLPMLPIYISYFIGEDEKKNNNVIKNSCGFVIGFTIIFLTLAIFASGIGKIINENIKYIKILFGIIIIVLGLNYSVGLGIPFIISATLLNQLKEVFTFIKKNYNIIKKVSGGILIIMGIYMIFA